MSFDLRHRERLLGACSRRGLLAHLGMTGGLLGLQSLLAQAAEAQAPVNRDLLQRPTNDSPRVKRIIYLFQNGGPSHVDLFDPKPRLKKHDGEKPGSDFVNDVDAKKTGVWLGSPFDFRRYGRSGMEMSELLPELGNRHADNIALVRSMVSDHENHEQACCHMHTGSAISGRPTMGAWVTYALGTENQSLPAYVAILNPAGLPVDGARNWSSGWMPPLFQGMPVRAAKTSPILNLDPRIAADPARARLDFLQELNRRHRQGREDNLELEARISNFELAARMQLAATDALDVTTESAATHQLYGLDKPETEVYGRELLLARRLSERGVRFVQVMMTGQPWDTHSNNSNQLKTLCRSTDVPVSGLLTDLKQRGLLDETLVLWTGEFGRTPFAEGKDGRDHHKRAFSLWMAGGGIKGGVTHGGTDDFGYASVTDVVRVCDLHATILHLMGMRFKDLTFQHDARPQRLTDFHEAQIVKPILA